MVDSIGMSLSVDSPSDETLNQGPLTLLLGRRYEFLFRINIVQFSFFSMGMCTQFQVPKALFMFVQFLHLIEQISNVYIF